MLMESLYVVSKHGSGILTRELQADLRSRGLVSERKCNTVDAMVTTMVDCKCEMEAE